jgi:hypothetical protein
MSACVRTTSAAPLEQYIGPWRSALCACVCVRVCVRVCVWDTGSDLIYAGVAVLVYNYAGHVSWLVILVVLRITQPVAHIFDHITDKQTFPLGDKYMNADKFLIVCNKSVDLGMQLFCFSNVH